MTLLTNKPANIVAGTNNSLTVNKTQIIDLIVNSGHQDAAYYADESNWKRVVFYYQDSSKKQKTVVMFDSSTNQGKFKTSSKSKYNQWELRRIVIEDKDNGIFTLTRSTPAIINVLDSQSLEVISPNAAPTAITLTGTTNSEKSVLENTTFVGNLAVLDPNVGDTHSFLIENENDGQNFEIIGNNALHFKTPANYESKSSFLVKIRATDSGNLSVTETFVINVTNVPETPQSFSVSASQFVEYNLDFSTVAILTAVDPEGGASVAFSLVSGDGSTDNEAFYIEGNKLKTKVSFSYSKKSVYSVRMGATSSIGTTEQIFTFQVLQASNVLWSKTVTFQAPAVNRALYTEFPSGELGGASYWFSKISSDGKLMISNYGLFLKNNSNTWEQIQRLSAGNVGLAFIGGSADLKYVAYRPNSYSSIKIQKLIGSTYVDETNGTINVGDSQSTNMIYVTNDGTEVFVGRTSFTKNGFTSYGAVQHYKKSAGTWTLSQSISPDGYNTNLYVGSSFHYDESTQTLFCGSDTGRVFIFNKSNGLFSLTQTITTGSVPRQQLAFSNNQELLLRHTDNTIKTYINNNGTWTVSSSINALNSTYFNISPDCKTLVIGGTISNNYDIFVHTRATTNDSWALTKQLKYRNSNTFTISGQILVGNNEIFVKNCGYSYTYNGTDWVTGIVWHQNVEVSATATLPVFFFNSQYGLYAGPGQWAGSTTSNDYRYFRFDQTTKTITSLDSGLVGSAQVGSYYRSFTNPSNFSDAFSKPLSYSSTPKIVFSKNKKYMACRSSSTEFRVYKNTGPEGGFPYWTLVMEKVDFVSGSAPINKVEVNRNEDTIAVSFSNSFEAIRIYRKNTNNAWIAEYNITTNNVSISSSESALYGTATIPASFFSASANQIFLSDSGDIIGVSIYAYKRNSSPAGWTQAGTFTGSPIGFDSNNIALTIHSNSIKSWALSGSAWTQQATLLNISTSTDSYTGLSDAFLTADNDKIIIRRNWTTDNRYYKIDYYKYTGSTMARIVTLDKVQFWSSTNFAWNWDGVTPSGSLITVYQNDSMYKELFEISAT